MGSVSLPLSCVTEVRQGYLPEGRAVPGWALSLSGFTAHAFNLCATQPSGTCAFSEFCIPADKGQSCLSSSIAGSWVAVGGSQSSAFSKGFLGPSSICCGIGCKLCAGCPTLSHPDASKWEKVTLSSGQPGLSTKRGKIISRDKNNFFLKNCFCRATFSDVKSTFKKNLLLWQNRGEWEQSYFIYPKQSIKRTWNWTSNSNK